MVRVLAILVLVSFPLFSTQSENRPAVMRVVDVKTGRETGALSDAQVDQIVHFVKTLSGVNHHVQEVDGTRPSEVLVHTGWIRAGVGHGDLLRIERRNGRWVLLRKSKWKLANLIEQEY